jgi:hypothetical protein
MSRLVDAILQVTTTWTVNDMARELKLPRSTAGRWLKDLRERSDISAWSADMVERLTDYETTKLGTSQIVDALRPREPDPTPPHPREVRQQITKTVRRVETLKFSLEDMENFMRCDAATARKILAKTDEALRDSTQQQGLLARLRTCLSRRLRGTSEAR